MKIVVIGAGAWGTALAACASAAAGAHHVTLWARRADQVAALRQLHQNPRYLPGVTLPTALAFSDIPLASLAQLGASSDLVVVATPMSGLRAMLRAAETQVSSHGFWGTDLRAAASDRRK